MTVLAVPAVCLSADSSNEMQLWLNETDGRKPKYWEQNLFQRHFAHHKFHEYWFGIKPGNPQWDADDKERPTITGQLSEPRHGPLSGHTASRSTEKQSARKGCFVRSEIEAELEYSQKMPVNFLHSASYECNSEAAICLDAPNVFTIRVIL